MSEYEQPEYVKDLIKGGIRSNLDEIKLNGWNILMLAVRYAKKYSPETIKALIAKEPNINYQDNDGWTALMIASRFSNEESSLESVKLLIDSGADLDLREEKDATALMLSVAVNNTTSSLETVETLINAGADLNMKNKNGYSYLDK